jgi:hypothetical protein
MSDSEMSKKPLIKVLMLLAAGLLITSLFKGNSQKREEPEGLIQILPYTLYDMYDPGADESQKWRVEFILPVELQSDGQTICEALVNGQQYLALTTIEPHSQNGMTRFAPVWVRDALHSNERYRCDLNVNGSNIPWQVPQAELDEINFKNRTRISL